MKELSNEEITKFNMEVGSFEGFRRKWISNIVFLGRFLSGTSRELEDIRHKLSSGNYDLSESQQLLVNEVLTKEEGYLVKKSFFLSVVMIFVLIGSLFGTLSFLLNFPKFLLKIS